MSKEKTIAQQLNVKTFPFTIKDNKGNQIYFEDGKGYWDKREFDDKRNATYSENSDGYWDKREYDDKGNQIYYEDSRGYWRKFEHNDKGNIIYCEDSNGEIIDKRPKSIPEYTMEELTAKLGHSFKIKK